MRASTLAAGLGLLAFLATPATAQTDQQQREPCEGSPWWVETEATFEDFDFWIGEWQVYDAVSGELRGFDDIEKDLSGCTISQHWRQMDDSYSPPGSGRRLQGKSLSGINADGEWRQIWVDNGGGNLVFTGGFVDGVMSITSEWYTVPGREGPVTIRNVWNWRPLNQNEIHDWGFIERQDGEAEPVKYFDIVYRRGVLGGPAANLREEADGQQSGA